MNTKEFAPDEIRRRARQDLLIGIPLFAAGMAVTLLGGGSLGGWFIPTLMGTTFGASRAIRGAMQMRLAATQERLVSAADATLSAPAERTGAFSSALVADEPTRRPAEDQDANDSDTTFAYPTVHKIGIVVGIVFFFAVAAISLGLAAYGVLTGQVAWTIFWLMPLLGFGYLGRHGLVVRRYADVAVTLTKRGFDVVRGGERRSYSWHDGSRLIEHRYTRTFRLLDPNGETVFVFDRDVAHMAALHAVLERELASST